MRHSDKSSERELSVGCACLGCSVYSISSNATTAIQTTSQGMKRLNGRAGRVAISTCVLACVPGVTCVPGVPCANGEDDLGDEHRRECDGCHDVGGKSERASERHGGRKCAASDDYRHHRAARLHGSGVPGRRTVTPKVSRPRPGGG